MHIAKLRLKAQTIGINRIEASNTGGSIEFSDHTKVDPMQLMRLVQKQPAVYKMVPPNKFKFVKANEGEQDRFTLVTTILNELLP